MGIAFSMLLYVYKSRHPLRGVLQGERYCGRGNLAPFRDLKKPAISYSVMGIDIMEESYE